MQHQGVGNDIPTRGEVIMHFDKNDSFVVEQLIHQFELEYPQAKILPQYFSHQELLQLLNKGEVQGIFLHRSFTNEEKKVLEKKQIKSRSVMVFKNSSAIIAHRSNRSAIQYSDFINWLAGENSISEEALVLYGKGGRFLEMADSVLSQQGKKLRRKIISVNSPLGVIQQVQSNAQWLGVIGVNWLADDGDSLSLALRKQVSILGFYPEQAKNIQSPESAAVGDIIYPFQSQIADGSYPWIEPVWGYDLQGYSGLVSGFLAFVCSHPGQVLIKKSGIYPALPPHRTIEIQ